MNLNISQACEKNPFVHRTQAVLLLQKQQPEVLHVFVFCHKLCISLCSAEPRQRTGIEPAVMTTEATLNLHSSTQRRVNGKNPPYVTKEKT